MGENQKQSGALDLFLEVSPKKILPIGRKPSQVPVFLKNRRDGPIVPEEVPGLENSVAVLLSPAIPFRKPLSAGIQQQWNVPVFRDRVPKESQKILLDWGGG